MAPHTQAEVVNAGAPWRHLEHILIVLVTQTNIVVSHQLTYFDTLSVYLSSFAPTEAASLSVHCLEAEQSLCGH